MSVTTGRGDKGRTGILGSSRCNKWSPRFEAVGDVDELSTILGIARQSTEDERVAREILVIQKDLYRLNAELAAESQEVLSRLSVMLIGPGDVRRVEERVRELERQIDRLKGFVIPGGGNIVSARLDHARAVCRRAERRVGRFLSEQGTIDGDTSILKYLNRLSDYLFILARHTETTRTYAEDGK